MISLVAKRLTGKKDSGFTLIEILTVIIVIGVLAAVVIPVFSAQRGRAQDGKTVSDVRNIVTATETYLADKSNTIASVSGATVEVRTSAGTYYDVIGNTATGGYCIVAYNSLGKKFNSTSAQLTYDSTGGGLYKYGSSCQGLVTGGAITGKSSDGSTFTGSPAGNNTGSGSTGSGTGSNGSGTGVGSDTVTGAIPPASYGGGGTGVGSSTTVPAASTVTYTCPPDSGSLDANGTTCTTPADVYTGNRNTGSYTSSYSYPVYTYMCVDVTDSWTGKVSRNCYNNMHYETGYSTSYYDYYTCPRGGDLNGSTCTIPSKTVNATKTTNYSCPAGYRLEGTTCAKV